MNWSKQGRKSFRIGPSTPDGLAGRTSTIARVGVKQRSPEGYTPHIGETLQYWRNIILGVNDGLVSIFLLVVGVVSGGLDRTQVLLTAIAGAIAGAVSMAAGEYLATKSQDKSSTPSWRWSKATSRSSGLSSWSSYAASSPAWA